MFNVELSVVGHGGCRRRLVRRLDLADAPGLASHLIAAVAACGPSIVMDLAGLDSIDSAAWGADAGTQMDTRKRWEMSWPPCSSGSAR